MTRFAQLPDAERADLIEEAAARLGVLPVIVEKDYWVCWMLGKLFDNTKISPYIVFKGGTSLSKVFGAIQRFSEDIDLSVSPVHLGFQESDLDDASSKSKRLKLFEHLQAACAKQVAGEFKTAIEKAVLPELGTRTDGRPWLTYEQNGRTNAPLILFRYPSALPLGLGYISPMVKLEFGSLTDQRPTGPHAVTPMLADAISTFQEERQNVIALEVERTFWEKATILHAEFHRPPSQPCRDRFARHYSDLAALWQHPAKNAALKRLDLLHQVAEFKGRFFSSRWSNYETAKQGSLRLCPLASRESELTKDYIAMASMFLVSPPAFANVLGVLREAEREINKQ